MNPERIEGLIKHDPEVLVLWREAMKEKTGPKLKGDDGLCNIVTETKGTTGNSRSYTVSRLQREAPDPRARGANRVCHKMTNPILP